MKQLYRLRLVAIILFLASCEGIRTQNLPRETLKVGGIEVSAEIARTPEERSRGLMYRTNLKDDEGMLFIFENVEYHSFWMKNTLIPLDVAFFDEQGFLIELHTMSVDDGEKTYVSSEVSKYALEMNAGWFEKHGLKKYARLKLPESLKKY